MVNRKFIEVFNINDWEIETDTGWSDVISVGKTIQYDVWTIQTKTYNLKCADTHIVFDSNMNEIYVKDLHIGDLIYTIDGIEPVTHIEKLNHIDHMYDLELSDKNHRYYTNGILSHNSIWLSNIAANAVKSGTNTAIITLEMKDKKVIKRIGANLLNVSMNDYDEFSKNPNELKHRLDNISLNMLVDRRGELIVKEFPTSSASVPDIEIYLQKLEETLNIKLDLIVVDYINLIQDWHNPHGDNTYIKIKRVAEDLRAMATRNEWCVVTATQITRSAFGANDLKLENTSESTGLINTVDALFGILQTTQMYNRSVYYLKAIALRDSKNMDVRKEFNINYDYMRIAETDEHAFVAETEDQKNGTHGQYSNLNRIADDYTRELDNLI